MARGDLRDALEEQVHASLRQGAKAPVGGERTGGPGYFYAPTVLTGLSPQMPVLAEETFGPVAAVVRVKDADEAIKARPTTRPSGWAPTCGPRDIDAARELARRIEAG